MAENNSTTRKRNVVAMVIILVAIAVFLWMFWMVGEAGYNQTVPR